MSDFLQNPSLTMKLKNKSAVERLKSGNSSQSVVAALRQKCRDRMKEKRGELFARKREGLMNTFNEEFHQTFSDIIHDLYDEISTSNFGNHLNEPETSFISVDDALRLEKELLVEEEQWFLREYESMQKDQEELLSLFSDEFNESLVCPLCEKGRVIQTSTGLKCEFCQLHLPHEIRVEDFAKLIQNRLGIHYQTCNKQPSFMVLPENDNLSLYLTCEVCETMELIL